MAERRPPGFNVDLGFYDSDEVLSIPRKIRAAAIGVWTLCGSYSANKLSDGYVSAEALRDRGCTPAIRAALMATKPEPLWTPGDDVGGIRFTRWPKWQRTSAEVKAYREGEAERKRKAREAKKALAASQDPKMSGRTSAGPSPSVRPEDGDPKTKTETETKTEFFSYVQDAPHESDATRERGDNLSPPVTIGATRLVERTIPQGAINDATRAGLRIEASALITGGETETDVAECLRLWLTKPDLGVKALKALMAEVYKTRNGHPRPSTADRRFADTQALKNQPTRLEIET